MWLSFGKGRRWFLADNGGWRVTTIVTLLWGFFNKFFSILEFKNKEKIKTIVLPH